MNRSDFVKAIYLDSEKTIPKGQINDVLRCAENVLIKTVAQGEDIQLFGGFKIKTQVAKQRELVNPASGKKQILPEHLVCKLLTGDSFRDRINPDYLDEYAELNGE